ncbi:MAG TPA: heparan-alpha-glucosaminide N-acetyltransferase domain-containing protein, partial [Gemmatimonadales bacterium]|nr:heparan-alpha-glucosaminide N-acetyltransferase domain-containing protein [Gemmatimonadales bacterium]
MIGEAQAKAQGRVERMPRRISGVDTARGLALIGMFVAHVAEPAASVDLTELIALADERPRLLFALTAGIGLGLLTGGTRPAVGEKWVLRRQIAIRALLLIALGVFVVAVFNPLVFVILDVYGVAFLLMRPLIFIPWRTAIAVGAVLLTVTPAIASMAERDPAWLLVRDSGGGFVVDWFLTGAYPVIIWVPVMLIGLGLARADVAAPAVVRGYALGGVVAASVCLPVSRLLPGAASLGVDDAAAAWGLPLRASLEAMGNVGVGLVIVAACVTLTALARPRVRRVAGAVLSPVTAMGAMPLTIYTAHLVVIASSKRVVDGFVTDDSWALLVGLVIGSMVFAWLWQRFVGRGPLEAAFRWASGRGRSGSGGAGGGGPASAPAPPGPPSAVARPAPA